MGRLRTFGIFAHIDAGKTTTTEAFLLEAGQIARKGNIDDGTTTMDFMTQERERGITIQSAATCFPWGKAFFQLIDTPGHVDFSAEVQLALCAVDGACVLLDASRGVEAQTRAIWKALNSTGHSTAKLIFVNKMDRDGVDMDACLEAIRQRLNAWPLQVNAVYQVPRAVWCATRGDKVKKTHSVSPQAVIDLTDFRTALYPPVSNSMDAPLPVFYSPPPHALSHLLSASPSVLPHSSSPSPCAPDVAWAWWSDPRVVADVTNRREKLLEDLSLLDDAFEECVAERTLNRTHAGQSATNANEPEMRGPDAFARLTFKDEVRSTLRQVVLKNLGVPVLFGSSFFSRGVTQLLDAISAFLPSPLDRPPLPLASPLLASPLLASASPGAAGARNAPAASSAAASCISSCGRFLVPDRQAAAACVAFKVYPDGKGGRIAFVRVLSGRITPRTPLFNSTKHCLESPSSSSRLQLFRVKADAYESVASLSSGDIGAIRGLSAVTAGDLLRVSSAPAFSLPLLSPFHRHLPAVSPPAPDGRPSSLLPHGTAEDATASPSPSSASSPPFVSSASALHSLSPVCFTSIECRNAREETEVGEALAAACLSDVALKFERDEGGKFVLWGMGELHLQVVQARLKDEFGLSVEFGPLEIAYRELLLHPVRGKLTFSPSAASSFEISFSLLPLPSTPPEQRLSAILSRQEDPGLLALCHASRETGAVPFPSFSSATCTHATHVLFSLSPQAAAQLDALERTQKKAPPRHKQGSGRLAQASPSLEGSVLLRAIQEAACHAVGAGPLLSYPLDFLHVRLESLSQKDASSPLSPASLSAASAQLLRMLLRTGRGERASPCEKETSQTETETATGRGADAHLAHAASGTLRERIAMLEPVMHLEICSPSQNLGPLMRDLTQQRRASIVSISAGKETAGTEDAEEEGAGCLAAEGGELRISEEESGMMELHAVVPLRCMANYSSVLRALSHGQAHFQMRPLGYGRVSAIDEEILLAEAGILSLPS